jgi:exonuclease III
MVSHANKNKFTLDKKNIIKVFHQNIQGLRTIYNELLCHLQEQSPHVLCLAEHHLVNEEIVHLTLDNYLLGAYYCRNHFKKGGTCIYIHNSLKFSTINLENYCCDKDIEVCAVCINSNSYRLCILSVYKSPTSNYDMFLEKIEMILEKLCKKYVRVIICGDFNVNISSIKHMKFWQCQMDCLIMKLNFKL